MDTHIHIYVVLSFGCSVALSFCLSIYRLYTCVWVYAHSAHMPHMHVYVHAHACVHARMYVWSCACAHACARPHSCTPAHARARPRTPAHARMRPRAHTPARNLIIRIVAAMPVSPVRGTARLHAEKRRQHNHSKTNA